MPAHPLATLALRGLRTPAARAAVLVLNRAPAGDVRTTVAMAGRLASERWVVAVDGGLRACRRAGLVPDLLVGDGDSLGRAPVVAERVSFPADKDFSDLAGALREVARRGLRLALVAGLCGGRLDHEWANLLELDRHSRAIPAILAPTARGTVLFTSRGFRLATVPGAGFSMLAPSATATVTLRGARWGLERRRLRPGSHGLSNVTGARLELTVHRGSVVVVPLPLPAS